MKSQIRRLAVVVAAVVAMTGLVAPSPALALANIPDHSELGRWWLNTANPADMVGTGTRTMKNSSGQKIGEYRLTAVHWRSQGGESSFELQICVTDTLANGRGVIARVLLKYGTSSSKEVIKHKGNGCSDTLYPSNPTAVWAVDVDHGEDWSGTPYQYTGYFDRYGAMVNASQTWPYFDVY
ncbi:MAG: hypothetical protein HOV79_23375 [Hamadaea sp.]|nr:hypothetical protein [Hamadaea sp.]